MIYSIHIPLRTAKKIAFVNSPIASTVLYNVIIYTIIHAVIAVKIIDSNLVFGILYSSIRFVPVSCSFDS